MDIITQAAKRLYNEAMIEVSLVTRMTIMLALTVAVVIVALLPWWITAPLLVAGWAVLAKSHYDAAVAWATDSPDSEEEPTDDKEVVDTEEQK